MKGHLAVVWEKLRSSYWFIPSAMAVAAGLLSILTLTLDRTEVLDPLLVRSGLFWSGGPDGARELLAVIAGSMITVAGVTFSLTIVALQLASTQFGPRVLGSFMRNEVNQFVLGTFTATFLYCLLVLRTVFGEESGGFVPNLSVTVGTLLAIASVGVLIYFIHHLAESIRAENIVAAIGKDLVYSIEKVCPHPACPVPARLPDVPDGEDCCAVVKSHETGVVQSISVEQVVAAARDDRVTIRLLRRPGQFVAEGEPLGRVWPPPDPAGVVAIESAVNRAFTIGRHRTLVQDLEYAAHQLAEVGVRALSPSTNDPFTAIAALDHLEAALGKLLRRALPAPVVDAGGGARVVFEPWTFEDVVDTSLDRIRAYGCAHPIVLARLLDVLTALAELAVRTGDLRVLERQAERVRESMQVPNLIPSDRRALEEKTTAALEALHATRTRLSDAVARRRAEDAAPSTEPFAGALAPAI